MPQGWPAEAGGPLSAEKGTGIVTAKPGEAPAARATAYRQQLTIQAPRERVFDAVATLDGLCRWWTTIVTGSAAPGGTLRFGFAGLEEQIVMRVDAVRPLTAITWSCVAHTRDDEWTGSTVRFGLAGRRSQACELDFLHDGIGRELVAAGWEHFLASLAAYAEHGTGSPYGA
jgi:uncharacterized protein YndB with AHSA1/START domain